MFELFLYFYGSNINNNYDMELSIRKVENSEEDEPDSYKLQFKFMDDIERRKIPVKSYYVNQLKKNRK